MIFWTGIIIEERDCVELIKLLGTEMWDRGSDS